MYADFTSHLLDEGLANGKSQACALYKAVQLDEASENTFLLVFLNTASGIGHIEIKYLFFAYFIAEMYATCFCEFDGVCYQIDDDL